MIIGKTYSKEDGIEKVWYQSSTIKHSVFNDKEFTLKIVFKQGRTYTYKDVSTFDYLMFRNGFGTDQSQGLSFNKFIKKYEYQRLDDTSEVLLEQELNEVLTKQKEEKEKNTEKEEIGDIKMNIAFDFDGVLSSSQTMRDLCKILLYCGHNVFIITKRCTTYKEYIEKIEEYPKHEVPIEDDYHKDIDTISNELGIKKENIIFTFGESKVKCYKDYKIDVMFEDEEQNVIELNKNGCLTIKTN